MQRNEKTGQPAELTGSPARLNDGGWGVRVIGNADAGKVVEVKTRSGKSWQSEIEVVLWTGTDNRTGKTVSLCRMVGDRGGSADSSRKPNPVADAGREVARLAARFGNGGDERARLQLVDAIRNLCGTIGAADLLSGGAGNAPGGEFLDADAPPPDDDDLPF